MGSLGITRIGDGEYLVEVNGRRERVFVAGPAHDRWAFWNGRVYRGSIAAPPARARRDRHAGAHLIAAPMPATVIKVLVSAGQAIKKGDTVVVLEAMKMELPIRATGDAVVTAVRCAQGDLVQADATLIELA
jgi:3-methylcrotonyl-CoA carboxylase alpha subunit